MHVYFYKSLKSKSDLSKSKFHSNNIIMFTLEDEKSVIGNIKKIPKTDIYRNKLLNTKRKFTMYSEQYLN